MDTHKTAVTMTDIEAVIVEEKYVKPTADGMITICIMTLKNGARVTGTNYGAIDPARHDAEKGKQEARRKAIDKVFELEGYLLRQRLMERAERVAPIKGMKAYSPFRSWSADLAAYKNVFVPAVKIIPATIDYPENGLTSPLLPNTKIDLRPLFSYDLSIDLSKCSIFVTTVYLEIDGLVVELPTKNAKGNGFSNKRPGNLFYSELDLLLHRRIGGVEISGEVCWVNIEIVAAGDYNTEANEICVKFTQPKLLSVSSANGAQRGADAAAIALIEKSSVLGYDIVLLEDHGMVLEGAKKEHLDKPAFSVKSGLENQSWAIHYMPKHTPGHSRVCIDSTSIVPTEETLKLPFESNYADGELCPFLPATCKVKRFYVSANELQYEAIPIKMPSMEEVNLNFDLSPTREVVINRAMYASVRIGMHKDVLVSFYVNLYVNPYLGDILLETTDFKIITVRSTSKSPTLDDLAVLANGKVTGFSFRAILDPVPPHAKEVQMAGESTKLL